MDPDAKQFEVGDPAGLLKWAAVDRASVTFRTGAEVDEHLDAFLDVLRQWISLTT